MSQKVGRNDPCPCGSGKKYKKCHPGEYDTAARLARSLPDMLLLGCWVPNDIDEIGIGPVVFARCNPVTARMLLLSGATNPTVYAIAVHFLYPGVGLWWGTLIAFIISFISMQYLVAPLMAHLTRPTK